MNLLPFENIEIESPLTKNEIEIAIKNNVAWTTDFGMTFTKNSIHEYEGFIDNRTFTIRRILKSGMNSFIPLVRGTISDSRNGGSHIELKLRLHKVVMIFAIVFTMFSGLILVTSILSSPASKELQKEFLIEHSVDKDLANEIASNMDESTEQKSTNWIPLFLFASAPYLMCTIFFNYEANIVRNKLNSILKV